LLACLAKLGAGAAELQTAGFRSEGKALAELVKQMGEAAASAGRIRPRHLTEAKGHQEQLAKLAALWRSGGSAAKADVLTRHAGVLAEALEVLATATAAEAAAPAVTTVTVTLRMGIPGPNEDDRSRRSGRTGSGADGRKVLLVGLKELDRTFSSVSSLGGYVKSHADDLQTATIIFDVASEVAWHDVKAVVGAFGSLSGETRFADLTLRPPPAPAPAAPDPGGKTRSTAPKPTPAGGRAGRPAVAAAPSWASPLAGESKAAAALAEMTAGRKRILVALDLSAETYPAVRKLLLKRLAGLAEGAKVGVVALDADRRPVLLVDWRPTDPLGRKLAAKAMATHLPPRSGGNFVAMIRRVLDEPSACDAVVVVTAGSRVPVKANTYSVLAALARHRVPVGMLVIGEVDPTVASAIRNATSGPGRRAVYLPAGPFQTVAAKH